MRRGPGFWRNLAAHCVRHPLRFRQVKRSADSSDRASSLLTDMRYRLLRRQWLSCRSQPGRRVPYGRISHLRAEPLRLAEPRDRRLYLRNNAAAGCFAPRAGSAGTQIALPSLVHRLRRQHRLRMHRYAGRLPYALPTFLRPGLLRFVPPPDQSRALRRLRRGVRRCGLYRARRRRRRRLRRRSVRDLGVRCWIRLRCGVGCMPRRIGEQSGRNAPFGRARSSCSGLARNPGFPRHSRHCRSSPVYAEPRSSRGPSEENKPSGSSVTTRFPSKSKGHSEKTS